MRGLPISMRLNTRRRSFDKLRTILRQAPDERGPRAARLPRRYAPRNDRIKLCWSRSQINASTRESRECGRNLLPLPCPPHRVRRAPLLSHPSQKRPDPRVGPQQLHTVQLFSQRRYRKHRVYLTVARRTQSRLRSVVAATRPWHQMMHGEPLHVSPAQFANPVSRVRRRPGPFHRHDAPVCPGLRIVLYPSAPASP